MTTLTEADVEDAALEWLAALGWQTAHGPDIGPGGTSEERPDYGAVVLERRLRDALARLNPNLPRDALDNAFRKLTRPEGSTLEARNRAFHRMLVAGVNVEVPHGWRSDPRSTGRRHRLRRACRQRLPRGQPGHGHRARAHPPPGCRAVRQRPAARRDRAQEPGRRGGRHLDGVAAAPDLPGRAAHPVLDERAARRLGRHGGAPRHAHGGAGVVQAVAHGRGRGPGGGDRAGAASAPRGRLRAGAAAPAAPRLRRLRGRRQRRAREEDGRLPPVPRRAHRRRRDAAGSQVRPG